MFKTSMCTLSCCRYPIRFFHTYSMRITWCALLVLASGDCQTLEESIINHVHSSIVGTEASETTDLV